jgi:hypothetical protein
LHHFNRHLSSLVVHILWSGSFRLDEGISKMSFEFGKNGAALCTLRPECLPNIQRQSQRPHWFCPWEINAKLLETGAYYK